MPQEQQKIKKAKKRFEIFIFLHAKKLAKALNDNINRFEKNFGSIKDYDNPKFQLNFGPTGKA